MITRFAPSPTGQLHIGHLYSALTISKIAGEHDASVLLRIEDIDSTRCRPEFTQAIFDDLSWFDFSWHEPVRYQSRHYADYENALDRLKNLGLLYPCSCSRKDIAAKGATPGWDGLVYPGTCRHRTLEDEQHGDALRLDIRKAMKQTDTTLCFLENGPEYAGMHRIGPQDILANIGDPVLRRKDTGDPAYHLACTYDDALQNITHVIRGADLFRQTWLHVLIQTLMGWPTLIYHHHKLIRNDEGVRLSKIALSKSIRTYREDGATQGELRCLLGI